MSASTPSAFLSLNHRNSLFVEPTIDLTHITNTSVRALHLRVDRFLPTSAGDLQPIQKPGPEHSLRLREPAVASSRGRIAGSNTRHFANYYSVLSPSNGVAYHAMPSKSVLWSMGSAAL